MVLGNLDARRDWGFAGDYVEAMWLMLQQDEADDYVIATGETHSIRDFLDVAFAPRRHRRLDAATSRQDPRFMRPAEVDLLIGDASQGPRQAGLEAHRSPSSELVAMMVDADLAARQGRLVTHARRVRHRHRRPGRQLPRRAAAGRRRRGPRAGAPDADRPPGALPRGVALHAGTSRDVDGAPGGWCSTWRPTRSTTSAAISSVARSWERARPRPPTSTAAPRSALLESARRCRSVAAARCASCRPPAPRSSASRPRRRRTRTPRPPGRTRTAPPRPTRTSRSASTAAAACTRPAAILYNHESPRRPSSSSPARSPPTVAAIAAGRADGLVLGNLDARRDWGWAPDYVDAMVPRRPRRRRPATTSSPPARRTRVRDFVAAAFARGRHRRLGAAGATSTPRFVRPADADRADRRRDAGARAARLGADRRLRGDRGADGRRRPRRASRDRDGSPLSASPSRYAPYPLLLSGSARSPSSSSESHPSATRPPRARRS